MLNYELFKKVVVEKILDYMPDDFRNYKVDVHPTPYINVVRDALSLFPADNGQCNVTPIIYINDIYEKYQHSGDFERELEFVASNIIETFQYMPERIKEHDLENLKNIIMVIVNTEQNRRLLAGVPHREFLDLSIIYRLVTKEDKDGIASAIITYSHAEKLGMDEDALYCVANINTRKLFPPVIRSLFDVVQEMHIEDGIQVDNEYAMTQEIPLEHAMYIIGNEIGINGAVSMLYEEVIHKLADKLGSDLYIMPSSIHEVIAISSRNRDPNELVNMVVEINMGVVALEERLSNQVYHYSRDLRKLSLATDTLNKRLDGTM